MSIPFDEKKQATITANEILDVPYADPDRNEAILARQYLRAIELQTYEENKSMLIACIIWHLNNRDKKGNSTTEMNIPNAVFSVLDKKLAQLSHDKKMSETEVMEIVRKR